VDPLGIAAAVAFQLLLNPINGRAVPVGALPSIPEFGQASNGGFVFRQVEPTDQGLDRIMFRVAFDTAGVRLRV